ncbi:ATP-binding cassette domain-containing protein [Aquipuribacter sp. SD81]|uniref:ATP-binding cassette domain-containing protein n=1 Tax=Aquipuribacter sp. SD81 TaxID=3127703 RepID=UPI00301831B3
MSGRHAAGPPVAGVPADGASAGGVRGTDGGARSPGDVVVVAGVTHRAGGSTVLDDVSLRVRGGSVVVLAGRSGSGKSTLCHLVAGVTRPSDGTVAVAGRPAQPPPAWSVVTLLPQRLALVEDLTVAENVEWPCRLAGREVPDGLLTGLHLAHLLDRPARSTSLGEQQRTALARALAPRPLVAVLDEPTGHQDDANVDRVVAALREAAAAGCCVLVATHDDRVVAAADRVVRLEGGRVVE